MDMVGLAKQNRTPDMPDIVRVCPATKQTDKKPSVRGLFVRVSCPGRTVVTSDTGESEMLVNEDYKVAPPVGLRVAGKGGQIFECVGHEPYVRKDGNEITLSIWTSNCRSCGTPIRCGSPIWVTDVARFNKHCDEHGRRR